MPPPGGPPPAGRSGGAGGWVKSHKPIAYGGAALGAVGVVLYLRKKSGGAASSTAPGTDSTGATPAGTATYADTSGDYSSLESQIANLQSQISADQVNESRPVTGTPIPGPKPRPRPKPKPKPKRTRYPRRHVPKRRS